MFRKMAVLLVAVACVLGWQVLATAQSSNAAVHARKAAINALLKGAGASADVRLLKDKDEYVRFAGTSPLSPIANGHAGPTEEVARDFVRQHKAAFMDDSPAADFEAVRTRRGPAQAFVRLQQLYSGIPVFRGEMTVQVNPANKVVAVFSDIKRETDDLDSGAVSLSPKVRASEAESLAIQLVQESKKGHSGQKKVEADFAPGWLDVGLDLEASPAQLVLFAPEVVGAGGPTRLVWETVVSAVNDPAVREVVLVDAVTKGVAFHCSLAYSALSRLVYDANNTSSDPGTLVRSEGGAPVGLADANYAYDYFGDTYDFYFAEHGRDSVDGAGMILSGTVGFCPTGETPPYANAFWSGTRMYFGQGYASADDVVAHELTHGVTSYESDLIYFNQSGAINESFSDMWGEWVDLTNGAGTDTLAVRWLMGEDLPIGAIRNMANPPEFGDPDRMGSPYYSANIGDEGGVHYNSGVGNNLCRLLTDGGTFNGRTVAGMGISRTAELFYEVQTNLLTSAADYQDLYVLLLQAAENLEYSQADMLNLVEACLAVELGVEPDKLAVGQWVGTWPLPMYTYFHDSRTTSIYLASEIGRSGRITGLALYVDTVPGQQLQYWTVRLKTTSLNAFSSASMDATGWTTCYQAHVTVNAPGQATFTFTTPFQYNGTSNLMVDFSHNNSSYSTYGQCLAAVPGGNRSIYAASDSAYGDPLTWSGVNSPKKYLATAVPSIALTFSPAAATVTNITSAHADGAFKAGEIVDIDVVFSTAVTVNGAPTLELETGATDRMATYVGGNGTNTLTFRYTVAPGDTSEDLNYTSGGALRLNGAVVKDVGTQTAATLTLPAPGSAGSLGANKAIVIDTTAPMATVTSTESSPTSANPIPFAVDFSESVSDFGQSGVAVANGVVASYGGSGAHYEVQITPAGSGDVTLTVAAGVAHDAAGNSNAGPASCTVVYAAPVSFPDPVLRAAVLAAIGKTSEPIFESDLAGLTSLEVVGGSTAGAKVADLTGLEHCVALQHLGLSRNLITDLGAISGLTSLTYLNLATNSLAGDDLAALAALTNLTYLNASLNQVTSVSGLQGMTQMRYLLLDYNRVADISPLQDMTLLQELWMRGNLVLSIGAVSGMSQLRVLHMSSNGVADAAPLAGCTQLVYLSLSANALTNVSALEGLTGLSNVYLYGNSISDLSPLVNNAGLGAGDTLNVANNPLSLVSGNTYIPALQARGVNVVFNGTYPPNAPVVSGPATSSDGKPAWTWVSGGGGGTGTYRHQLDSEAGVWTTVAETSFTPSTALALGVHTLYLQERNAAGLWSASGSKAVEVLAVPELLVNGSFEAGVDPGAALKLAAGSTGLSGWTVGGAGVYYVGSYYQAGQGARCIKLTLQKPGWIAQAIATTPGQTYRVTFLMAGDPFPYLTPAEKIKTLEVSASAGATVVGSQQFTFDTTGKNVRNMGWDARNWTFTATSTETVLRIASVSPGPYGPCVDNVLVVAE